MSDLSWRPVTVTLSELQPWARNPRRLSKKQAARLLQSWDDLGQFQTIAIGPGGEVYDGHQRLSVLKAAHGNDYTVQALQASRALTEAEREALTILSQTAAGSWDWDALAGWDTALLQSLGLDADLLAGLNDDAANLREMLNSEKPAPVDAEPQIDRAEELREKWGVETGQLWQLGAHRLICGDCTDKAVVERVMGGEVAAITFTSPPYNAGVSAQLSGNTSIDDNLYKDEYNDNQTQSDYLSLLANFTDVALSNSQYVFVNIQFLAGNKTAFVDYLTRFRDNLADIAIWDKTNAAPAAAQRVMDSRFEFVLIYSHKANRAIGTREFRGMVHNVYTGNPQRNNKYASSHAATFPVDFPEHFINTFTNDGELIFEPFAGTGTTLIACERLGRKCRAVEISPAYVAVTLQRWADLTGKTPVLLERQGS